MAQPNIAKIARELAKFTKNKSKSELSDKLDASSETIQMGEDGEDLSIKDSAGVSVAKLIKMLKSTSKVKKGKHDPEEMLGEDGEDLSTDENVIDEQKLAEQEEIIRRITKKREV